MEEEEEEDGGLVGLETRGLKTILDFDDFCGTKSKSQGAVFKTELNVTKNVSCDRRFSGRDFAPRVWRRFPPRFMRLLARDGETCVGEQRWNESGQRF